MGIISQIESEGQPENMMPRLYKCCLAARDLGFHEVKTPQSTRLHTNDQRASGRGPIARGSASHHRNGRGPEQNHPANRQAKPMSAVRQGSTRQGNEPPHDTRHPSGTRKRDREGQALTACQIKVDEPPLTRWYHQTRTSLTAPLRSSFHARHWRSNRDRNQDPD